MQYKKRNLEGLIGQLFDIFPIVAVTGPRQAGKSTLIKHFIDNQWNYHTLDNRELLLRIKSDPTLFVKSLTTHTVIDEAQKCPDLFPAIKEIVDSDFPYKILISGSANFLLLKSITESLAGRVGLLELLPFSLSERSGIESNQLVETICGCETIESLHETLTEKNKHRLPEPGILDFILHGGYPKIYNLRSEPARLRWFQDYISTYLERDLRDLAQVADIGTFQQVYKLIAFQNSGVLNMSSMASDVGISVHTVKKYISILESSYQCKMLQSYHFNQRKQIIKSPKIYYTDTGLVNYFVRNHTVERMTHTGGWGGTLEAHVFSELYKEIKDMVPRPSLYYWRTNNGAEVDFVIQQGQRLIPVEVKSAIQVNASSLRGLKSFTESQPEGNVPFAVVLYRGEEVVYLDRFTLAVPLGILF